LLLLAYVRGGASQEEVLEMFGIVEHLLDAEREASTGERRPNQHG
jgi:hypothetical protein